ncbi:hypothetical protein ACU686_28030 [Yinghuangia aomiensis]
MPATPTSATHFDAGGGIFEQMGLLEAQFRDVPELIGTYGVLLMENLDPEAPLHAQAARQAGQQRRGDRPRDPAGPAGRPLPHRYRPGGQGRGGPGFPPRHRGSDVAAGHDAAPLRRGVPRVHRDGLIQRLAVRDAAD